MVAISDAFVGFHVIEVPIPINTTAIKFTFLRDGILKNGCCGAAELIKLSAYRYFSPLDFSCLRFECDDSSKGC
jgi:hypothetical protein